MNELKILALQWVAAFNAHDLEALLALYHDNAEHYSPKLKARMPDTNGLIRGKSELRTWWADAFLRLPNLHYRLVSLLADDKLIFMDYVRETPGEEDLRVGEVLEVKEGKIISSRVFHS